VDLAPLEVHLGLIRLQVDRSVEVRQGRLESLFLEHLFGVLEEFFPAHDIATQPDRTGHQTRQPDDDD
jgi:hypothetical protein